MNVDLLEAQKSLVELLERALDGEEIVITRDGIPVVQLFPVKRSALRPIGLRSHLGLSDASVQESLAPLTTNQLEGFERRELGFHLVEMTDDLLAPTERHVIDSFHDD
jgi:antitoxin (DNA-binding transcriptional repressor) of toxin-antitoxin stability system